VAKTIMRSTQMVDQRFIDYSSLSNVMVIVIVIKCYGALSTSVKNNSALQCLMLRKQMSLSNSEKSQSRNSVFDVGRNLVPNFETEDGEDTLPELGSCHHDNSCVCYSGTQLSASRLFTVEFDRAAETASMKHCVWRF